MGTAHGTSSEMLRCSSSILLPAPSGVQAPLALVVPFRQLLSTQSRCKAAPTAGDTTSPHSPAKCRSGIGFLFLLLASAPAPVSASGTEAASGVCLRAGVSRGRSEAFGGANPAPAPFLAAPHPSPAAASAALPGWQHTGSHTSQPRSTNRAQRTQPQSLCKPGTCRDQPWKNPARCCDGKDPSEHQEHC